MSRLGARVRERLSRHIPKTLTLYPFEVGMAVLMLLTGLAIVTGLASVPILVALVGKAAFLVWGSAQILAGVTISGGLLFKSPSVASSGLQLTSVLLAVYMAAVVVLFGWLHALPTLALYGTFTALSLVRSLHFRRIEDIQRGASQIRREGSM